MDKYDRAIAYFNGDDMPDGFDRRDQIKNRWLNADLGGHGCLFQYVTPDGTQNIRGEDGKQCGCLTQIRLGYPRVGKVKGQIPVVACTTALTQEIRRDKRIPTDPDKITLADLPVFAEWQRRLDKELGRA